MNPPERPGIYEHLPWEVYDKIPAVNNSLLSWFAKCPALCRLRIERREDPTAAMILGQAAHTALLEPDQLENRYAILRYDGRTKDGKAERELARSRGLPMIRLPDFEEASAIAASAYTHPRVRELFSDNPSFEQTTLWVVDGIARKARRDIVGSGWIAEFKTTSDINRFSPWVMTDLGYHRQAAWYSAANAALGLPEIEHFFFIVVETSEPYPSAVFRLADEALEEGRAENEELLRGYVKCVKTGSWPRHIEPLLPADIYRKG